MLLLILIGCDEVSNELTIDDEISTTDDIISEIVITVDDSTLSPSQTYYDSFAISAPENFIDISEHIVNLEFDSPHDNISVHEISIDPPVLFPKALMYTHLPHHNFWNEELLTSSWRITSSPPQSKWEGIALYGYTTEDSASIDTLTFNLSINGNAVFTDTTVIINFLPLNNAVHKSIPGITNYSEGSQRVKFQNRNFKTSIARAYRDPRNMHSFMLYHRPNGTTRLSGGLNYDVAHQMEAFFFFSNLPE